MKNFLIHLINRLNEITKPLKLIKYISRCSLNTDVKVILIKIQIDKYNDIKYWFMPEFKE